MDKSKEISRTSKNEKNQVLCVLTGTLWGIALGAVLLLISCAAGLSMNDPEKYVPVLALSVFFITSFISGFSVSKKSDKSGVRCGIGAGLLFSALIVLVSFVSGLPLKPLLFAICAPVAVVTSIFGGIAGEGKRNGKMKRKKHRKIKF